MTTIFMAIVNIMLLFLSVPFITMAVSSARFNKRLKAYESKEKTYKEMIDEDQTSGIDFSLFFFKCISVLAIAILLASVIVDHISFLVAVQRLSVILLTLSIPATFFYIENISRKEAVTLFKKILNERKDKIFNYFEFNEAINIKEKIEHDKNFLDFLKEHNKTVDDECCLFQKRINGDFKINFVENNIRYDFLFTHGELVIEIYKNIKEQDSKTISYKELEPKDYNFLKRKLEPYLSLKEISSLYTDNKNINVNDALDFLRKKDEKKEIEEIKEKLFHYSPETRQMLKTLEEVMESKKNMEKNL